MRIKVLPQTLINQIAAGEVIVRMASVVKELVENSIDAGASRIEVSVSNEARDLEIRDDGCGMERDDAELSLQRHATSKIRTLDDLTHLVTRGFRGEALASIAAVSRMELHTRREGDLEGTRIEIEGGVIHRIESEGCPSGTRTVVRDLFYNTPARLKFLKSPVAELNAIAQVLTRQALAASTVGVRYLREGVEQFSFPPDQDAMERFASMLGSALTAPLVPIAHEREGVMVGGCIAPPACTRADRRSQFFFVNGRPISSKTLTGALEQAFRGHLMVQRHPIALVMIEVPPEDVDFNVHPTKEEVRFRDERSIGGAVYRAVEVAVQTGAARGVSITTAPGESAEDAPPPAGGAPAFFHSVEALAMRSFESKMRPPATQRDWIAEAKRMEALGATSPEYAPAIGTPATQQGSAPLVLRHGDNSSISASPGEIPDIEFWAGHYDPEPLGQIASTYILARHGSDLLIVDQHAAHERLVYLELARKTREVESQPLLLPILVELPPNLHETARDAVRALADLGFDIEPMGGRAWAVRSVPTDVDNADIAGLVLDLMGDFESSPREEALTRRRDRILIRVACHSAIRAGQELDRRAMQELLEQMRRERLSFCCPHGRPTIVRVTQHELERWFKRVV